MRNTFFTRVAGRLALAVTALVSTLGAGEAGAQPSLLVNNNASGWYVYDGIHYGGGVWGSTTALLQATFGAGLGTTSSLLDLGAMLQYDALWVDQRFQTAPLAEEMANLAAYAATGRRVVIVGENATWGPWNAAVLGAIGGAEGPGHDQWWYWMNGRADGCRDGTTTTATAHALTAGVASVNMACGGHAVGGTPLFAYNVATVWGARQNVLTVLDANLFDDRFMIAGNVQFRQNLMTWLATPVVTTPEPATLALVGGGLLALGVVARRRRG